MALLAFWSKFSLTFLPIIERIMNKGFKSGNSLFRIYNWNLSLETTNNNKEPKQSCISYFVEDEDGILHIKDLNRHRDGQVEFSGNLCYMILRHSVRGHFSPFVLSEIRPCDWLTQTGRALVGGHSRESELLLANSLPALQPNLPCRLETQALNLLLNLYLPFPHF